jgi:LemA protein
MMGVMIAAGILVFAVIAVAGWAVSTYNALVAMKNQVEQAWANIDVLLKQRRDELLKLIDTVKGVKDFESGTLKAVTEARGRAAGAVGTAASVAAASAESAAIRGFFAVAEAYPQLQSNQNFKQLQERISAIENQVADRRELYNDSVNSYNTGIAVFPDSIFAGILGYQRQQYYRVDEADKSDVKVKF